MTNKLTAEEINKMCDRLKYKYPQYQKREDLKSEAILAIYERLATNPAEHPAYLYNLAREAMFDYVNLKDKPVPMPANKTTRSVAGHRHIPKSSLYSKEGLLAIQSALRPTQEYEDSLSLSVPDCAEGYEARDLLTKCLNSLSGRSRKVIEMRYLKEMTQAEVANVYKVSQQAVALWEEEALDKMSEL
jgi:RNA polymerase sigma factor (sigma-70 family)|tara:strand:+ start:943 stop:1506 length:564 start_codon:yes stop_codon:yes gene_type:complete